MTNWFIRIRILLAVKSALISREKNCAIFLMVKQFGFTLII